MRDVTPCVVQRIKQAKPADRPALKEAAVELHSKLNMTFKDHLHEEEEIVRATQTAPRV
jgi:hypothetical protein